jgi:(1->4)-alpha-D-glucan 1-alpha-D-glucosylmutase
VASSLSSWGQRVADAVERAVTDRLSHPTASYRLQFQKGQLTFRDAAALVPYLDELGVSHLYASPCLKTRSGSAHGYDVVDYGQLDPELGSADDYRALADALRSRGMGQILDTVPNHMSATPVENSWWNDVLENGPGSPYAGYFDIDWHPVKEELHDRVLLPMLGDQYGQVLESGELKLEHREGSLFIRYGQKRLPLDPGTYRVILTHRLDKLKEALPADSEELRELESIATACEHLPGRTDVDPARVAERQREKEVVKTRIRSLVGRSPAIAEFIRQNTEEFNGRPDDPHSYDELDKLLDAQVYRLSHWKAAVDEINYRRFFDVNELAAVCMEDPRVFEESHRLVFDLLVRGDVAGLRIDHIDGLYDPTEYLRRLQWGYLRALGRAHYQRIAEARPEHCPIVAGAPGAAESPDEPPPWNELEPAFLRAVAEGFERLLPVPASFLPAPGTGENHSAPQPAALDNYRGARLPLYVLVEKILSPEEPLPEHWLVAGTTGYDFLNSVNGLFVDRPGLEDLARLYSRFIDERLDFREVAHQSKLLILRASMPSELMLLAHRLNRISERHRRTRDFTLNTLRVALREILACFPVYRTYIHAGCVSEADRQFVHRAVAQAKRRNPATNAALFDFIRDVLLLEQPPGLDEAGRRERELFVGRFQQVTSPVIAKGIEDTAFYRYFPLASLNEVGGNPARGTTSVEEFHRQNLARQARWPRSLTATTTHDTKRSEDVRARIDVLAEIPHLWRAAVNRWARLNRRHRREVDGQPAPSRNDEYLFYQSLVGVWPLQPPDDAALRPLAERLQIYMEKATREAKVHTSWINPHWDYDAAVRQFVAAALDGRPKNRFLGEFRRFHEQVVNWGLFTALSQTLLKLTSPGVPDIYQGQELWDFSLVDPDNRRPVDFARRRDMLARLRAIIAAGDPALAALARQLAQNPRDPRLKLFVTWRVLQFRRRHAELFQLGDYIPLDVQGPRARHVCAFARVCGSPLGAGPKIAIVIVPRLIAQLTPLAPDSSPAPSPVGSAVWEDTHVMVGDWASSPLKNLFTGQECSPQDSRVLAAAALSDFPVALLTSAGGVSGELG